MSSVYFVTCKLFSHIANSSFVALDTLDAYDSRRIKRRCEFCFSSGPEEEKRQRERERESVRWFVCSALPALLGQ